MNKQAKKIVDNIINKAKKERDTKGYRENLGYDQYPTLTDKISKLNLSYQEECQIKNYFSEQCDSI